MKHSKSTSVAEGQFSLNAFEDNSFGLRWNGILFVKKFGKSLSRYMLFDGRFFYDLTISSIKLSDPYVNEFLTFRSFSRKVKDISMLYERIL
jgi:hypothetical protein